MRHFEAHENASLGSGASCRLGITTKLNGTIMRQDHNIELKGGIERVITSQERMKNAVAAVHE